MNCDLELPFNLDGVMEIIVSGLSTRCFIEFLPKAGVLAPLTDEEAELGKIRSPMTFNGRARSRTSKPSPLCLGGLHLAFRPQRCRVVTYFIGF